MSERAKNTTLIMGRNTSASVICCMAIGMLQAMKKGAIEPDWGIWTIGMPGFWKPLEEKAVLSPEALKVFRSFDELDAYAMLGGDVEKLIDNWLTILYGELQAHGLPTTWNLDWKIE